MIHMKTNLVERVQCYGDGIEVHTSAVKRKKRMVFSKVGNIVNLIVNSAQLYLVFEQ
jgi:hypothetical protein